MRAVFGLLLIMLGLAMAIVWMPEHNGERQLAVVTDIATQGFNRRSDAPDRTGRTFSPHTPLLATVEAPGARQPQLTVGVARVAVPSVETVQTSPALQVVGASSVVTGTIAAGTPPPPVVVGLPAARTLDGSLGGRPSAAPEMSRDELVRTLQRELKRVGCYWGDVDGDWGTGSRRAMGAFTDRLNASLPVEQPDFILLTLLKGHQGPICGKACPSGQVAADNGRCVPNAVVAQARRVQDRRTGAPRDDAGTAAAVADSGWNTRLTRGTASTAATSIDPPSTLAAAASVTVAAAALPGRMGAGGPQGGSGGYVSAPAETAAARDAVRGAPSDLAGATPRAERARRGTGSRRPVPAYALGYPVYRSGYAPPPVYRAPRTVAYGSPPRRSSRTWTASFFGGP